jgi:hypothetical protein
MKIKSLKLPGINAIALTLSVCLHQPAQANDVLVYLQDYFGGVNNNITYSEAEKMTRLDADRAEIDGRISAALSAGRINGAQAADFHAQLRSNRALEFQLARDGRFSFSDHQTIASALSDTNVRLQNAISNNVVFNPRPGFGIPPRGYVNRKDVNDLQNKIANRLQQGRSSGRLTMSEYQSLRNELNTIEARERQMASSRGFLSFQENQRLMARLNRLQDQLRVEMNDSQVAGRQHFPWY